ncbi:hypothetical protein V496_08360 [Pseudogymnoascus sp. VKM F-4515 (FW-2607)]|nr:hypothetical protein V496_08360 [Pseudogymnoascus sp. VKM F-4515 (FW-2607)]
MLSLASRQLFSQIIHYTGNGRIHDPAPYIAVPAKGSEALKTTLEPGESGFVATHIVTVIEAENILSDSYKSIFQPRAFIQHLR